MSRGNGNGSITRTDIESKLRSIRDSIEPMGDQAVGGLKAAIPVVAVVIILAAFVVGRRSGKKRRAIIEIRRI